MNPTLRMLARKPWLRFFTDPADGGGGGGTGGTGEPDEGAGGKGGQAGDDQSGKTGGTDKGFPENTPLVEMTVDQREAYWKHQARKHESTAKARADYDDLKKKADKYEKLQREKLTPDEKALEDARKEAREQALAEARADTAGRIVAAEFRAALAGKRTADQVAALLEPLDLTKFLTDSGEVDTDKVTKYAAGIAPAGGKWPDTGQGNRGSHEKATGVNAGKDLYAERRKK